MKGYLGLGSNLGNRKEHLENAIKKLRERIRPKRLRVSSIYESPALLPALCNADWNRDFLNLVIEVDCELNPQDLLKVTQDIENESGRVRTEKWAPRELDIDILFFENQNFISRQLVLPHPEVTNRAFVLAPLKDLAPGLEIKQGNCVLNLSRSHPQQVPSLMGIVNITPDSFSDGGKFQERSLIEEELKQLVDNNIAIIDIGGESTRPGAIPLSSDQEWDRIKGSLEFLKSELRDREIRPLLSIDTRHFQTALNALEYGATIINDVSGLADLRFVELLKQTKIQYVLTHSLSVTADPLTVLDEKINVMVEIKNWFIQKLEILFSNGVQRDQIILDPGIGFGKTALQSQTILQQIDDLYDLNCRVLMGHSRKSFLGAFSHTTPKDRDIESLGVSLALANNGVDILRVHNPVLHKRALAGWSHARKDLS
jgi:2-amino-4-hydroxy-6-hydroxymethyldihydropteridine diphosphokinase / dihydropteroate synthase